MSNHEIDRLAGEYHKARTWMKGKGVSFEKFLANPEWYAQRFSHTLKKWAPESPCPKYYGLRIHIN